MHLLFFPRYIFLLFKRFSARLIVHNFRMVMFLWCNDRCGTIFVGDRMLDAGPLYRQHMRSVAAISLRSLERFRAKCGNFCLTARVAGRKRASLAFSVHQNREDFVRSSRDFDAKFVRPRCREHAFSAPIVLPTRSRVLSTLCVLCGAPWLSARNRASGGMRGEMWISDSGARGVGICRKGLV